MLTVSVDISEVRSLTEAAEATVGSSATTMKSILDAQAQVSRDTHAYQNRTGNLEASTFAGDIIQSGDEREVEFGARMFYSSFVENLGYQHIEQDAEDADAIIQGEFEAQADALSGM